MLSTSTIVRIFSRIFGCHYKAMAVFRITLGSLLLTEVLLRLQYVHAFYSDQGTLPLKFVTTKVDPLYKYMCVHCMSGSIAVQNGLIIMQALLAIGLILGYRTQLCSVISWFLYVSLTLCNTWLAYILDRYFHYLLFYSMFLPTGRIWSLDRYLTTPNTTCQKDDDDASSNPTILSMATICIKLQIVWIYLDAGLGKLQDPRGGWSWNADPLPALDTYARHTVAARYMYALLGPPGLRFITPIVVWVELLAAPVCMLGLLFEWNTLVMISISCICQLHLGIAATLRNTVLLSLVACCAWTLYLPQVNILFHMMEQISSHLGECVPFCFKKSHQSAHSASSTSSTAQSPTTTVRPLSIASNLLIALFIVGSLWFEIASNECNQSVSHIWSTLLHNRWNVFTGAEEYVTWEIAPGRLENGDIVDVWAMSDELKWEMPGTAATTRRTTRKGRWRSFPYLAGLKGEESKILWGYLCRQWDREMGADIFPGNKLLRFNFFMLQADVLPDMRFSATRKRLLHSQNCEELEPKTNDDSPSRVLDEL